MAYITLAQAKKHLNIESGYTEDDSYITTLIDVAESTIESHINEKLADLVEGGVIPPPLYQAALLLIGNFYQNREPIGIGRENKLPYNYEYLINLYRNFNN